MTASFVLTIKIERGSLSQRIELECGPSGLSLCIPAAASPGQTAIPSGVARGQTTRQIALLEAYRSDPQLDASRVVGVSRATVYNYLSELEQAGLIRRNGDGVEVL